VALEAGRKAPDFALRGSFGKRVSLKHYRGKTVVLYFYPKDDTPGCTTEACEFSGLGPRPAMRKLFED
jgi:peroxiredoxin Q/BCP